ncbi:MAG TPA: hypothetical protein VG389_16940, partial [Myxococcota bacterium]|nr:hypothetical protein [Myxococcota bacterium]
GCRNKHEPEAIGPYDFCVTLNDCSAGRVCLQNLCVDPTTEFLEACAVSMPCPDLPGATTDLASEVDVREGAAAMEANRLLVVRTILGVDMYAYLFDASIPLAPALDLDGVSIVDVPAEPDRPRLTCTGFGYGLAWTDSRLGERSVWFGRVTRDGVPVTSDVLVSRRGREADLAWTGNDFGITWTNPPGERDPGVWFQRVDGVGFLETDDPLLVADRVNGGPAYPSIAHDGVDRFAIAWNDGTIVRFALVDAAGSVVFNDQIGMGASGARAVQVVYNGDGWGVMWRDANGATLRSLEADGLPRAGPTPLGTFAGDVDEHRLMWAGDRYWGAWADPTLSPGSITISAADIDAVVLDSTTVNGGGVSASPPHLFGASGIAGVVFSVETRPGEPNPDDLVYSTVFCN